MRGLVLTAMPEEGEFWQELGQRVNDQPCWQIKMPWGELWHAATGIGKVAATYNTQHWLQQIAPDWLIMTGTSGAIGKLAKETHGVVLAEQVFDVDFGAFAADGPHFDFHNYYRDKQDRIIPLTWSADETLYRAMRQHWQSQLSLFCGRVATSDYLPNTAQQTQILNDFQISAVACEDSAVSFVAWQQQIPCVCMRIFSNIAGEDFTIEDLKKSGYQLSQSVYETIKQMIPNL